MRTTIVLLILLCAALLAPAPERPQAAGAAAGDPKAGMPFTLVVLPDTQTYTLSAPEIFTAQTRWIRDNKDKWNIAFVAHLGDIVENGPKEDEWQRANESMSLLDGVVPYGIVPGNHDYNSTSARNTTLYNKYFPVSRFEKQPWYGGHFGENNDNSYQTFRTEGMDFLSLCLELGPRDEVLEWAGGVIARYPRHRVIVITHCYLNFDGTRVRKGHEYHTSTYVRKGNDGEAIWEKLVSQHKNIFLVLSGHMLGPAARLIGEGREGNRVHELFSNYQGSKKGWLRIMTFLPRENRIDVTTYSPTLDKYLEDGNNKFSLDYAMQPGKSGPPDKPNNNQ
ncbi:MAG: metallophosphoesterase [Planctomycetota bacterium]